MRAAFMVLVLLPFGCPRPGGGAPDAAASERDAALAATTSAPAADAGIVDATPWIVFNVEAGTAPAPRVGGRAVRPEIELPARSVAIESSFPFVALRTRGLPAVSNDGTRVAHVYGTARCCRGTGFTAFTLHVFDPKTGATKTKAVLWSVDDERLAPQPDEKSLRAYERTLRARESAAKALLDGEWKTLASLEVGEEDDLPLLRGEGLEIRRATKAPFPPIAVTRDGSTRTFPGERFKVHVAGCPAASMALRLVGGYGLRDQPFAIVETMEGFGAPDGCEGSTMQLLSWAK